MRNLSASGPLGQTLLARRELLLTFRGTSASIGRSYWALGNLEPNSEDDRHWRCLAPWPVACDRSRVWILAARANREPQMSRLQKEPPRQSFAFLAHKALLSTTELPNMRGSCGLTHKLDERSIAPAAGRRMCGGAQGAGVRNISRPPPPALTGP